MRALLISILVCAILSNVYSWRFFHNGRRKGGNLGVPRTHPLRNKISDTTALVTQKLDHFDEGNQATWQQRYFVNDQFFDTTKRNVAFLFIGGEGEASDLWMWYGAWTEFAYKHNAILFQLEHRFYGESRPTVDLSVENLRYLTSEQALADLATFVEAMNKNYNLASDVKWIVFGGSYAGSLAAWARLKYPNLIHGAVSSSGPLLAISDFQDYFKVVGDDLRTVSDECYSAVRAGTAQIDNLLQDQAGQKIITNMFHLCDPLEEDNNNVNDIALLYAALADHFAGIAQYNQNDTSWSTDIGVITLKTICDIMTDTSSGDELIRFAYFHQLMLESNGQICLDFKYSRMIEEMRYVDWDAPASEGARQWTFQTCNEFGFYQTSSSQPQIFGDKFPLEFFVQQCIDIFGPQFNETYLNAVVDRTNSIYGGLDIQVNNTVFVHGSVDPWHALGITTTGSQNAPAIYITGTSHCADMNPSSEVDLPQLKAAREEIGQHIQSWLNV